MYTTCAFCNAKLDGDGGPSSLGVGRRIAFDEWKGRLWVICTKCARWNLSPLDDRLERIDTVARAARDAKLLAATDHVALLRWQRYDLVRVGKPPRIELAPWRYGERLKALRHERHKYVIPLTVAAVGLGIAANVAAGGSLGVFVWNLHRDRKSTRLNSSHVAISYAVFCLKKKKVVALGGCVNDGMKPVPWTLDEIAGN